MAWSDAPEFDDYGRELLPDTIYDPVIDDHGKRVGWKVKPGERDVWDALAKQHAGRTGVYAATNGNVKKFETKPLEQLVAEIKPWVIDFSRGLEQDMADAYRDDAEAVTRLVWSIVQGCEAKRIHSPGGILRNRLNDLRTEQADRLR